MMSDIWAGGVKVNGGVVDDPVSRLQDKGDVSLRSLQRLNESRSDKWHDGGTPWTGADWSNEMMGEGGEAANVVKKIRRLETSVQARPTETGFHQLQEKLAHEIADVVICAGLLASYYGIDLADAVATKFNKTSIEHGFPERLL